MSVDRIWYIYRINNLSLNGWRSFGVRHEHVKDNRDMTAMARALNLLTKTNPDVDWYADYYEYWILECPCAPPFICLRRDNPFEVGYIVSPIPLPHISHIVDKDWQIGGTEIIPA